MLRKGRLSSVAGILSAAIVSILTACAGVSTNLETKYSVPGTTPATSVYILTDDKFSTHYPQIEKSLKTCLADKLRALNIDTHYVRNQSIQLDSAAEQTDDKIVQDNSHLLMISLEHMGQRSTIPSATVTDSVIVGLSLIAERDYTMMMGDNLPQPTANAANVTFFDLQHKKMLYMGRLTYPSRTSEFSLEIGEGVGVESCEKLFAVLQSTIATIGTD